MGQEQSSSESGHGNQGSNRRRRRGRREHSDIPSSSTQPAYNDELSYGGFCPVCRTGTDNLERHLRRHHRELREEDLGAWVDTEEPEKPLYGKDMHPSNRDFSAQNTMTPSSFESRQIPLDRRESDKAASSSASSSVTYPSTSQDSYVPTDAELGARTWEHVWPSQTRRDSQLSGAPSSERSVSSSGSTVRAFSKRSFEKLEGRDTSPDLEDQPEGRDTSHAAQHEPQQDSIASPSSSALYESSRVSGSIQPAAREYYHPPASAQPRHEAQDDRGRERNKQGHYSSTRNSSRQSEPRSHREREPRWSDHAQPRQHPHRSSENTTQWHRRRREPSRTRVSHQAEAKPSRSARYDKVSPREPYTRRDDYAGHSRTEHRGERSRTRMPPQAEAGPSRNARYDEARTRIPRQAEAESSRSASYDDFSARGQYSRRDDYAGHSTSERARPVRAYVQQTERVVFPGDRSQFSPSYLREIGNLRFGNTGRFNDREDEGGYYDEEYDSDNHMYPPEYLHKMVETRGWKGSQRS